jgi:hypothetical protein
LFAAGCSAGSLGSSDEGAGGQGGGVTLTFLTGSTDTEVASANAIIDAFQAANPNENYRSAELSDGIKMIAEGQGAHYPQLGGVSANIENVAPGKSKDVGFFPIPGKDPAAFGMTVWSGNGLYIPKTVEGDKLDAGGWLGQGLTA